MEKMMRKHQPIWMSNGIVYQRSAPQKNIYKQTFKKQIQSKGLVYHALNKRKPADEHSPLSLCLCPPCSFWLLTNK